MTVDQLKELVEGKLKRHYGVEAAKASKKMVYDACAQVVRDMMMEKWFTRESLQSLMKHCQHIRQTVS